MPYLMTPCLLLVLSAMPAAAQEAVSPGTAEDAAWEAPARHIPLRAGPPPSEPPQVRVSPGQATVLLFDTPLAGVDVEGGARFGRVRLADDTVTLVPAVHWVEGTRATLVARFQDGAAPASTQLQLVVHAAMAERQVYVDRRPRPAESLAAELAAREEVVRRLTAEVERLQRAPGGPGGLAGLLAAGHMGPGGVAAKNVFSEVKGRPRNALRVRDAAAFRGADSLALQVMMNNPLAAAPWRVEGAVLVDTEGAALPVRTLWQEADIQPGLSGRVVVEVEATAATPSGPYTLTLWAAGMLRSVVLGNVIFPGPPRTSRPEGAPRR